MSLFFKQIATNSRDIQKKSFFHHEINPTTLRLVRANGGKPFIIVAPNGMGKTAFAAAYAEKYYFQKPIYWLDGSKQQFRHLLVAGDLLTWFKEQLEDLRQAQFNPDGQPSKSSTQQLPWKPARSHLVVIDNVPQLSSSQIQAFKDLLELFAGENWEVFVLCTPERDYFHSGTQSFFKLKNQNLLDETEISPSQTSYCIKAFFEQGLPDDMYRFAAALLLIGKGDLKSLDETGLVPSDLELAALAGDYPFFGIDADAGVFDCWPSDFKTLSPLYKRFLLARDSRHDKEKQGEPKTQNRDLVMQVAKIALRQGRSQEGVDALSLVEDSDAVMRILSSISQEAQDAIRHSWPADKLEDSAAKGKVENSEVKEDAVSQPSDSAQNFSAWEELSARDRAKEQAEAEPWKRYGVTCIRRPGLQISKSGKICGSQGMVEPMYVRMFGGLEIFIGSRYIPDSEWRKNKAKLLFALLVVEQGRQVSRGTIISALWPSLDAASAVNNFYGAWYALRKLLSDDKGNCPYLGKSGTFCWIDKNYVVSDVEEFEFVAQNMIFVQGDAREAVNGYLRMQELYRDELFGAEVFPKLQMAAHRCKNSMVDGLLAASNQMLKMGDNVGAIWFARKAHEVDPGREDVCCQLMKLLVQAGQRAAAIEVYFSCCQNLEDSFGVAPSRATVELYENLVMEADSEHKSSETLFNEAAERRLTQRQRTGNNLNVLQSWQ